MTVRLVATDLDGTLVRSDNTVSERTRRAIALVEAAGVPFIMVTGRPPRWMAQIADATGHRGLAVCANGAVVYDLHTEQVVRTDLFSAEAALEVVAALREALPDIAFAVERHGAPFGHEPGYRPRWDSNDPKELGPVEQLLTAGVIKLLARHEAMDADALLAAARAAVGDGATLTHSSADGLVEISAAGVTKASGLAALAAEHGVDAADVIAFGDMPNDLPMLAWAGRGCAMGNAHPSVLAEADEVTVTNDEDGVAIVLESIFAAR